MVSKKTKQKKQDAQKTYAILIVSLFIVSVFVLFAGQLSSVGRAIDIPSDTNLSEVGLFEINTYSAPQSEFGFDFYQAVNLTPPFNPNATTHFIANFTDQSDTHFNFNISNSTGGVIVQEVLAKAGDEMTLHLNPEDDAIADLRVKMVGSLILFIDEHADVSTLRDPDGDGFELTDDNCPTVENPLQEDTDGDGIGDLCEDSDGDSILDADDNCPQTSNINQRDIDLDGLGDACDNDMDGDGVDNSEDNCVNVSNPDQAIDHPGDVDADDNPIGAECDVCTGYDLLGDDDADGICNIIPWYDEAVLNLTREYDQYDEEHDELKTTLDSTEEALDDAQRDLDRAIDRGQDQDEIDDLQDTVDDIMDTLTEANESTLDLLDDVDDLLYDIGDLIQDFKDYDFDNDTELDEGDLDDAEDDAKELEDKTEDLKQDIERTLGIRETTTTNTTSQNQTITCTMSWDCGDWGACISGEKTRSCVRDDTCDQQLADGTADRIQEVAMPAESATCQEATTSTSSTDDQICSPNLKRCFGDQLQKCNLAGTEWTPITSCSAGCNSATLSCNPSDEPDTQIPESDDNFGTLYLFIGIGLLVLIGGGAGAGFAVKAHKDKGLKEYIEETRSQGFADDQIRERLLEEGWSEKKVDNAMAA